MKNLTAKQLRGIRNGIMVAGMAAAFIIWLLIPSVIRNTKLVHVGNGKYGPKWGFLVVLLLPLFALIPQKPGEEIHSEDAEERARIAEEWERHSLKTQILYAVLEAVTACLCMALGVIFG